MDDTYDVILVGAGLGGLSAAAFLAQAGKRVLVVDKMDGVGGLAHHFRRGPYTFDPAIHFTVLGHEGEFLNFLLSHLGVADQVQFVSPAVSAAIDTPDGRVDLPPGLDATVEAMAAFVPGSGDSIRAFMDLAFEFTANSKAEDLRVDLKGLDDAAQRFPLLFKYRMSTVREVLDELVPDPKAQSLCAFGWPYLGAPPERMSFATYAAFLNAYVPKGPLACVGGFQTLADALASAIWSFGGHIALSTPATKILVEDGRAAGIEVEDGRTVRAETVISNADARLTFETLVGLEHLPEAFVRRLHRMKPSGSAVVLYAATTADPAAAGLPQEVLINRRWDHDEAWRDVTEGHIGGAWMVFPTMTDPSLAPPGEHEVILTSMACYDIGEPWADAKPRVLEEMLTECERILPGFRAGLTHSEMATPLTLERWTGVHRGAMYGWDNTAMQAAPKRLPQVTPIQGLYLAGQWANPGSGSYRSIFSGLTAAGIALGHPHIGEFIGSLMGAPVGTSDRHREGQPA